MPVGDSISARALLAASALVLSAACSKPEAQPATPSSAPAASAPSPALAPTPAPASPVVAIDPAWIEPDPQLTRLLAVATPACALKDTFMLSPDGNFSHGYSVWAPAVEQGELERRYREAAQALGFTVTNHPLLGLGFRDEARNRGGSISDARVEVLLVKIASARESAKKLVASLGFETWSLVEALGGSWKWVTVDRSAGGTTLDVKLPKTPDKRDKIDAWARDKKLERDGEAWLRKYRKDVPNPSSIFIEANGFDEIAILETRGTPLQGPGCVDHPSRKVKEEPRNTGKPAKSEDDLMREMMGK